MSDSVSRLDNDTRRRLKAAVFDANSYHPSPDLKNLEANATRLKMIGVELWVPEGVALEWAEHLITDWNALTVGMRNSRKRLNGAGFDFPPLPQMTSDAVAAQFLAKIASIDNVKLIHLTPKNALAGLRDQILLHAPAKRKGINEKKEGIKTGASDSAWLRDVIDAVNSDISSLLFVTEDRDVTLALESWGHPSVLCCPRSRLRDLLFEVALDVDGATQMALAFLSSKMPNSQDYGDPTIGGEWLDIGPVDDLAEILVADAWDLEDVEVSNAGLVALNSVAGLIDLRSTDEFADVEDLLGEPSPLVSKLGNIVRQWVTLRVVFSATARATVVGKDPDGAAHERVVTKGGLTIWSTLELELVEGQVVSARPDGDSRARYNENEYANPSDCLSALTESLSCVPGFSDADDILTRLADIGDSVSVNLDGLPSQLSIEFLRHDSWAYSFSIGGSDVTASCEYDSGARVWGGDDSLDMYPPYYLAIDGLDATDDDPSWSISAWLIREMFSPSSS
ncbi:hypothetical protein ACFQ34_00655 [Pseudonocardia benzenivorans]|uniref:NYN domain-containing protein n=1 Tax=Pseudonocardia benzenivorans TaxID=228005 RepID=A0ABW3VCN9_9PSEU